MPTVNDVGQIINEECSFYDVQVAPDRIRAALREALELDQTEGVISRALWTTLSRDRWAAGKK